MPRVKSRNVSNWMKLIAFYFSSRMLLNLWSCVIMSKYLFHFPYWPYCLAGYIHSQKYYNNKFVCFVLLSLIPGQNFTFYLSADVGVDFDDSFSSVTVWVVDGMPTIAFTPWANERLGFAYHDTFNFSAAMLLPGKTVLL